MKKILYRAGAATMFALTVATAGAAADNSQTGTISGTIGAGSSAKVTSVTKNHTFVKNDTDLHATNDSHISAYSGDATSKYNTGSGVGGATTGAVKATNATVMNANVTNGSGSGWAPSSSSSTGTISGTVGAGSSATVSSVQKNDTTVINDTDINVSNHSDVHATSGDATSEYNTGSGGTGATTGAVDASNSSQFSFNVTNK